jgi:single-strand DNA-binding protein
MGNLTRDPETRSVTGGQVVAELGLAINESYKDKDGKQIEKACFVDITVWGKQAETCRQYLKKGAPVLIEGKLQLDQWTTEGGEKRSRLRVKATRVQFLHKAPGAEGAPKTKTPIDAEEEFEPSPF